MGLPIQRYDLASASVYEESILNRVIGITTAVASSLHHAHYRSRPAIASSTVVDASDMDLPLGGESILTERSFSNGVHLRILPLGASIVFGQSSSDGNGFRLGLRNQLIFNGNPVNMVGSVNTGTMADGDCEGWPGYVITQVASKAELSIPSMPNLVLLHAGTNDAAQSTDVQNAGMDTSELQSMT
jgi:hypothetical protein